MGPRRPTPRLQVLHKIFEAQADARPHSVAVVFDRRETTYAALEERGYVGLEEQTQARFVPDRFAPASEAEARLYRTGDLGRLDADGNIEFLGRVDGQVKLRGFCIEMAEIEAVLAQGEGVFAAACTVREDVPGVRQLVGYVVPSNGHLDEEHLRLQLRRRLPAYMVPALIETVTELPRLPSGKLNRATLPAPRARDAVTQWVIT